MQTEMERRQEGEQIALLNPADLPSSPSSPVRWMFAAGGFGMGLAIGVGIAMWLELRDKSIRDEADVIAALELPMLVSLPWVGAEAGGKRSRDWRGRFTPSPGEKGAVVV
jgi:succinoglycan biosynthesis transport protein ExoP